MVDGALPPALFRSLARGVRIAVAKQEPDLEGFATLLDYARAPFGGGEPHEAHDAEAALRVGARYCLEKVEALGRVRRLVLQQLASLGDACTVPPADGAFYCLLRVNQRPAHSTHPGGLDGVSVATRLIRDHRVAVVPGEAFGLRDGCYLRVSYGALDPESVAEGMSRLVEGLRAVTSQM